MPAGASPHHPFLTSNRPPPTGSGTIPVAESKTVEGSKCRAHGRLFFSCRSMGAPFPGQHFTGIKVAVSLPEWPFSEQIATLGRRTPKRLVLEDEICGRFPTAWNPAASKFLIGGHVQKTIEPPSKGCRAEDSGHSRTKNKKIREDRALHSRQRVLMRTPKNRWPMPLLPPHHGPDCRWSTIVAD